jgi:predicted transcriptional regulator of viral defense system
MSDFINNLYKSKQSVFTSKEIALLSQEKRSASLKSKLAYYVKKGDLLRLRRGVFALGNDYDKNELAVRIFTPAYISFETVLAKEGIIFQYYSSVFVASYLSREISINETKFEYKKIKSGALFSKKGLVNRGTYFEATKERAFLDTLYLSRNYYFDKLDKIDWNLCFELVSLYSNRSLEKRLNKYYKNYAGQK